MKVAFLYSGQGSQLVGMGQSFYQSNEDSKEFLDNVEIDFDLKKLMFEGPLETLSETEFTQPCLVAYHIMVTRLLEKAGVKADYTCGLSLGEYSALYYADVFDDLTVIDLTRFRGVAMTNAVKGIESKMVACLTPDVELISELIGQVDAGYLAISNYNCPGQYVVAGEVQAIDQFKELADGKIKRLIELNTSGPFHTKLLEQASLDLKGKFETVTFNENSIPVIMNTTGQPLVFGEVKDLLARQVKEPVQFEKTLNYLVSQGVDTFVEIGPNKTLSNFVKKVDRKLNTYSIVDQESLEKVIELWQTK